MDYRGSGKIKVEHIMNDFVEIIEHVIQFMPMRQLQLCSQVCKKWNEVCKRIKPTRKQLHWFCIKETDFHNVAVDLKENIQWMPSLPRYALVFNSNELQERKLAVPSISSVRPRASKMEKVDVTDYLQRLLPPDCKILGCHSQGVVGTKSFQMRAEEFEDHSVLSCMFLPEMEGVEVSYFQLTPQTETLLDPHRVNSHRTVPPMDEVNHILGLPRSTRPKLILLLETEDGIEINMLRRQTTYYMLLKCYDTIIAGATGYGLYPEEPDQAEIAHVLDCVDDDEEETGHDQTWHDVSHTLGIAFSGDNVKVATVILDDEVTTRKQVEEKLRKLRQCHVPYSKCFGLILACEGRGEGHFKERNVESSVFNDMFPGVPLLGMFGQGEIGQDYLPDYAGDSRSGSSHSGDSHMSYSLRGEYIDRLGEPSDLPELTHTYTTVFVLVSLADK